MEKKEEETFEDGLHNQSLEEVESCSSSILDSDDEDDGINVTIKAVVPGCSTDESADQSGSKLGGAARRKIKKMVKDGMDQEEARAMVIAASTPKRSRNLALDSPTGSADTNPDPKKVCGSAATSSATTAITGDDQGVNDQSGATVSEVQEEIVVVEHGGSSGAIPTDTAAQDVTIVVVTNVDGDATEVETATESGDAEKGITTVESGATKDGKAIEEDGSKKEQGSGSSTQSGSSAFGGRGNKVGKKKFEGQGGSVNKKPRKEILPAPTYEQIASRVSLGIVPSGYPDVELTTDQQEIVKEALLEKVLSQRNEHLKLPWKDAQLVALDEADMPRKELILAFFYRSKKDDNDTIRGYLESLNDNLDTSAWKIIHRSVKSDHVDWVFTVDSASLKQLEERKFIVNYKYGQTRFKKKLSEGGSHPVDVDSEMDGGMDVDPSVQEASTEMETN